MGLADKVIVNSIDFKRQFKELFNIDAKCIYNPLNKSEILKYSKEYVELPLFKKIKKFKNNNNWKIYRSKRSFNSFKVFKRN